MGEKISHAECAVSFLVNIKTFIQLLLNKWHTAGDGFRYSSSESRNGSEQVQDERCCGQSACNVQRGGRRYLKWQKQYHSKVQQR